MGKKIKTTTIERFKTATEFFHGGHEAKAYVLALQKENKEKAISGTKKKK